ncbi:MAG: hypothetical protein FWF82_01315, partial [Oscillospiraceae bacterium]|nr:hypothetical protein [Oscillospiraceae bacterium]
MKVKKGNNSAISIKSFIIITLFLVIFSSCFTSIPDDRGEESQGGSLFTSQSVKPNYTITSATSAKPEIKPFDGELFSRSVYVVDMNSGEVFLAVNEKEKMIPASTVKIMTALHTLDLLSALGVIDSAVEVPDEVFAKFET